MLVSVIIPTYKNRGGLHDAITSALHQNYANLEVIVVDDNPPESVARKDTETLMRQFEDDERVIYLRHLENKNGAAARNTGIKGSKGDFIAFLDDDDKFLQGKLAKQVNYLVEHPEYDAVYCMAKRNGRPYGTDNSEGDCTREMLMLKTCIYTPCQMFRRESLITINGYDESFRRHQDYDLMLRFFHQGYKIGCLPEILTEIGANEGENIPSGKKMEEMKNYFFEKFMPYIDEIDSREKGFKNHVFAKHYAGVFLNHVKHRNFGMALMAFDRYFFKAPATFFGVLMNSVLLHMKGGI